MNHCVLIGNLTRDPELRKTQNEISICTFSVAVNRRPEGVDFFNIVAWRGLGENCYRYVKKGSKVAITGSIQNRQYDKDGQKRWVTEIIADEVEFLDRAEMKEVDEVLPWE